MDQTIKERKSTPTPILMMTKDYPKQMYGNSYCIQPPDSYAATNLRQGAERSAFRRENESRGRSATHIAFSLVLRGWIERLSKAQART